MTRFSLLRMKQRLARRLAQGLPLILSLALITGSSVVGCRRAAPPVEEADAGAAPAPIAQGQAAPAAASPPSTGGATATPAGGDGRKWLGKVPYDVWFDDPLATAANTTPVPGAGMANSGAAANAGAAMAGIGTAAPPTPGAAPGGMGASAPAVTGATDSAAPAAAGLDDWKAAISTDELQEELKQIRNRLTTNLQSAGKYSGNYKDIQADGAVIAALAAVMERHPDNVSWKPNARFLRDLGGELRAASQGLGRDSFEKTETVAEKITSVISGSVPPDVKDGGDKKPFGEAADRGGLMVRMQKAYDWLNSNITTEAKLKSEGETVIHEATILSLFSRIVADKSYESSSEDDYHKQAMACVAASAEMVEAAKGQNFAGFKDALTKTNNACTKCHNDYRFAE